MNSRNSTRLNFIVCTLSALVLLCPQIVSAVTLRYALVIGNNTGKDTDGQEPFDPLAHAETEAKVLKQKLVGLSNFDSSAKRTQLLLGATRSKVRQAIQKIVAQKKRDEKLLGKTESIFLLYFTGHGLQGKLLMKDGPMGAKEIGDLFNRVDADFAVGIFDACYSGSLSPKGVSPTPGINLLRELPQEVLSAKGSIWYVSSDAGQMSYEDKEIGGVFTHFFIEGLAKGRKEGPGITLDAIWNYARQKTVAYTAKHNRQQMPQQYITKLKSGAPIYFSFPQKRTATLVMSKSLHGKFALSYAGGQLTEMIYKKKGSPKKIAIYPGKATLTDISRGTVESVERLNVGAGQTLTLKNAKDKLGTSSVGKRKEILFSKGISDGQTVEANTVKTGVTLLGGVGYEYSTATKAMLLLEHRFGGSLRLDYGWFTAGVGVGYGLQNRDYPAWGYFSQGIYYHGYAGGALDAGSSRLCGGIQLGVNHVWQTLEDGTPRSSYQISPAGRLAVLLPRNKKVSVEIFANIGAANGLNASANPTRLWAFSIGGGVNLFFRIF